MTITRDVAALCAAIDAGDESALPALADALEEAGDGRAAGLRLCAGERGRSPWSRGWANMDDGAVRYWLRRWAHLACRPDDEQTLRGALEAVHGLYREAEVHAWGLGLLDLARRCEPAGAPRASVTSSPGGPYVPDSVRLSWAGTWTDGRWLCLEVWTVPGQLSGYLEWDTGTGCRSRFLDWPDLPSLILDSDYPDWGSSLDLPAEWPPSAAYLALAAALSD